MSVTRRRSTSVRLGKAELGANVVRALRGSWREKPTELDMEAGELERIGRHLVKGGAGGLVWRAISHRPELGGPEVRAELQQAFRSHALHSAIQLRHLDRVLEAANRRGIEPLLVKGAAIARRYPHPALRPYGDIDLVVEPAQVDELHLARLSVSSPPIPVDVDVEHAFVQADAVPLVEILGRATRVTFEQGVALIPGDGDMLRLLCLHFMRAAGRRALSLVDIALMLESAGNNDFDWDAALPPHSPRTQTIVATTAALAIDLLDAGADGTPFAKRVPAVPSWVRQRVLESFAAEPFSFLPDETFKLSPNPVAMARQLRERWPPDPIAVVVHHRVALRHRRPLQWQIYDYGARVVVNARRGDRDARLRAAT